MRDDRKAHDSRALDGETKMTTSTRTELDTRVTDRIIADLEQGVRPWEKPWHSSDAEGRALAGRSSELVVSKIPYVRLHALARELVFRHTRRKRHAQRGEAVHEHFWHS